MKPKIPDVDEIFAFGYTDPAFIHDIHILIGGEDKITKAKAALRTAMEEILGQPQVSKTGGYLPRYKRGKNDLFTEQHQRLARFMGEQE